MPRSHWDEHSAEYHISYAGYWYGKPRYKIQTIKFIRRSMLNHIKSNHFWRALDFNDSLGSKSISISAIKVAFMQIQAHTVSDIAVSFPNKYGESAPNISIDLVDRAVACTCAVDGGWWWGADVNGIELTKWKMIATLHTHIGKRIMILSCKSRIGLNVDVRVEHNTISINSCISNITVFQMVNNFEQTEWDSKNHVTHRIPARRHFTSLSALFLLIQIIKKYRRRWKKQGEQKF